MRLLGLTISDFRRLDVSIPLASAVVLFGPNDSGKTNILDAIYEAFTGKVARADRAADPFGEWPVVNIDVELDGAGMPGHPDQERLVSWIRASVEDAGPSLEPVQSALGELDSAGDEERAAALDSVIASYRDAVIAVLLAHAEQQCRDWQQEADAFELLLEECLQSRRFRVGFEVVWLLPERVALSGAAAAALERLDDADLWEGEMPLAGLVRESPAGLVQLCDESEPADVGRVVQIGSTTSFAELDHQIETFVEHELGRPGDHLAGGAGVLTRWQHRQLFTGEPWLEGKEGWVRLHPDVSELCARLGQRATAVAPDFVTRSYEIEVVAHQPNQWKRLGTRAGVRLVRRDDRRSFDLVVASAGVGIWAAYAVIEAMRQLAEEAESQDPATPTIFLVDEPERHLHPLAQEEIAAWLAQLARRNAHVLMATHSTPFLRLPLEHVAYLRVLRSSGETQVETISADVLGAVQESSAELGLSPAALIALARAWLFVEGEDDRLVLATLFGDELRQAGVMVLRFHGAGRAKATFANLELLTSLDLPISVLLDNVRAEAVQATSTTPNAKTEEERIAEQLRHASAAGTAVTLIPFPYPDIICALPEHTVRRALAMMNTKADCFTGWDDLVREHHNAQINGDRRNFKTFALDRLGLDFLTPSQFIARVLDEWDRQLPDRHPLRRAVDGILARADPAIPLPSA